MNISALVQNSIDEHQIILTTNGHAHILSIDPKPTGYGSSVNGAELMCLALATCFTNDIYREAAKRGIKVEGVEVEVESEFDGEGEPARSIKYSAKVEAQATRAEIHDLMLEVDRIAEIQNTIRRGTAVQFEGLEAVAVMQKNNREATVKTDIEV